AVVEERGDDDVGPEERAVLPNAPAFVLHVSFRAGDREELLRKALRDGLRRVERREIPADYFLRPIALESLGARVPGDDGPLRIEREYGIVRYAIDEQPIEAFVGLPRRVLGVSREGGGGRSTAGAPSRR